MSESVNKNYDIIAADLCLKDLGATKHFKGDAVLNIDSKQICKGTKVVHTQEDGVKALYSVWAYGSAKITPPLKHDMGVSDTLVSVVKKMEVPRLTLGALVEKLSNLTSVEEREGVLL